MVQLSRPMLRFIANNNLHDFARNPLVGKVANKIASVPKGKAGLIIGGVVLTGIAATAAYNYVSNQSSQTPAETPPSPPATATPNPPATAPANPSATAPANPSATAPANPSATGATTPPAKESIKYNEDEFTNNGENTLIVSPDNKLKVSVFNKTKDVTNDVLKFKLNGPYADKRLGEFKNGADLMAFYGINTPKNAKKASFITLTHLSGDKKSGNIREHVNVFDAEGNIIAHRQIKR